MDSRILIDLDASGPASITFHYEEGGVSAPYRVEVRQPLDVDALTDLQWYLEDYLRAPYAVYEDRGATVAERLTEWGHALFGEIFGQDPVRAEFDRLRAIAAPSGATEIVIRSEAPGWLGVPWELMLDPREREPLVLSGFEIARSLDAEQTPVLQVTAPTLRILMVISRPLGSADVEYQMIARPLSNLLKELPGEVEMTVLRPPTLEQLQEELGKARDEGAPFHIVHFDGHGALVRDQDGGYANYRERGLLLFEGDSGGAVPIPIESVASALAGARVPLVVLNACQSGAVGKELEAAMAAHLLAAGVPAVVAMAYKVYALGAAGFITAFYQELFRGATVADAVRAGRTHMARAPQRPSPRGPLPLKDWLVPVHYRHADVCFPVESRRATVPERDVAGPDFAPADGFVGRDDLFFRLEQAVRFDRVIVLHGLSGAGKTELAKAFGQWWAETGGTERPDMAFCYSFPRSGPPVSFKSVVESVDRALFGAGSGPARHDERLVRVEKYLAEHRALLIWDGIDTVQPPAADRVDFGAFVRRWSASGSSALLVTSVGTVDWLGDVHRIEVGGLTKIEAVAHTEATLNRSGALAQHRGEEVFDELIEWFEGHPASIGAVMSTLDDADPATVLSALRGSVPLRSSAAVTALAGTVGALVERLPPATRRALAVVCFGEGTVYTDMLLALSASSDAPDRFRGLDRNAWQDLLGQAVETGLAKSTYAGECYFVHPALPSYLAHGWRTEAGDAFEHEWENSRHCLAHCHAILCKQITEMMNSEHHEIAISSVRNYLRPLVFHFQECLHESDWPHAHSIGLPLCRYWERRGQLGYLTRWTSRVRAVTKGVNTAPPPLTDGRGSVWLLFVGTEAGVLAECGAPERALTIYREIAEYLAEQPATPALRMEMAVTHHQMGIAAHETGQFAEAERLYHLALDEFAAQKHLRFRANSCHQIGLVALGQGRLDDAETWTRESLDLRERIGDQAGIARSLAQLGTINRAQGDVASGNVHLRKAMEFFAQVGDRKGMVMCSLSLADDGQQGDRGIDPRTSLIISEQMGDRADQAAAYRVLSAMAQDHGQLKDAVDWLLQAIDRYREIGDAHRLAESRVRLGGIFVTLADDAVARNAPGEACGWSVLAAEIFEETDNQLRFAIASVNAAQYAAIAHVVADSPTDGTQLLAQADKRLRRVTPWLEQEGNLPLVVMAYYSRGLLAERLGNAVEARQHYTISLALSRSVGGGLVDELIRKRLVSLAPKADET